MYDESITPDDVLFDRLVDGELSAAERRELLASLDGRPTGWRRCALAFLEAQTWQDELALWPARSPRRAKRPSKKQNTILHTIRPSDYLPVGRSRHGSRLRLA